MDPKKYYTNQNHIKDLYTLLYYVHNGLISQGEQSVEKYKPDSEDNLYNAELILNLPLSLEQNYRDSRYDSNLSTSDFDKTLENINNSKENLD